MSNLSLPKLNAFIVRAKAATYVGGGAKTQSCRPASHDLQFMDGDWAYLDSYFGGIDFIGEETVWYAGNPVWAMNYDRLHFTSRTHHPCSSRTDDQS